MEDAVEEARGVAEAHEEEQMQNVHIRDCPTTEAGRHLQSRMETASLEGEDEVEGGEAEAVGTETVREARVRPRLLATTRTGRQHCLHRNQEGWASLVLA